MPQYAHPVRKIRQSTALNPPPPPLLLPQSRLGEWYGRWLLAPKDLCLSGTNTRSGAPTFRWPPDHYQCTRGSPVTLTSSHKTLCTASPVLHLRNRRATVDLVQDLALQVLREVHADVGDMEVHLLKAVSCEGGRTAAHKTLAEQSR